MEKHVASDEKFAGQHIGGATKNLDFPKGSNLQTILSVVFSQVTEVLVMLY